MDIASFPGNLVKKKVNDFVGDLFFPGGRIFDNIDILTLFFHQVMLTGKFFKCGGIILQIGQLFLCFLYFLHIIPFLGFQLCELGPSFFLLKEIALVKKQHPHYKKGCREKVFIGDDGSELFQGRC